MINIDDITLKVRPAGLTISLSWMQVISLLDIVDKHGVKLFIELGIHEGGIGSLLYMRAMIEDRFHYIGIDNTPAYVDKRFAQHIPYVDKFVHIYRDCFTQDTKNLVVTTVALHGKSLIFCDNGNKPKEVKLYTPALKVGDILVTHDYGTEIFDEDLQFLYDDPNMIELGDGYYRKEIKLPAFQRIK